jgi:hypothetical protein
MRDPRPGSTVVFHHHEAAVRLFGMRWPTRRGYEKRLREEVTRRLSAKSHPRKGTTRKGTNAPEVFDIFRAKGMIGFDGDRGRRGANGFGKRQDTKLERGVTAGSGGLRASSERPAGVP